MRITICMLTYRCEVHLYFCVCVRSNWVVVVVMFKPGLPPPSLPDLVLQGRRYNYGIVSFGFNQKCRSKYTVVHVDIHRRRITCLATTKLRGIVVMMLSWHAKGPGFKPLWNFCFTTQLVKQKFQVGFEPWSFSMPAEQHNHYTMELCCRKACDSPCMNVNMHHSIVTLNWLTQG